MTNPPAPCLISIHPRHVAAILSGVKTVECRKSAIGLAPGVFVYLYATSPSKAIQGQARIGALFTGSPSEMWEMHGDRTGITRGEFFEYYGQSRKAVLLSLVDVLAFGSPVELATLREIQPGFMPPQTARKLSSAFSSVTALGLPQPRSTA